MQVSVSRVSPVSVDVKIELPSDQVRDEVKKAYAALSKVAQVRGFRRGKVPMGVLKQYYRERVTLEVTERLIERSLVRALSENEITPLAPPRVTDLQPLDEAADFRFTASVEVRPIIPAVDLSEVSITRLVHSIDDADVAHELEHWRERAATLRSVDPPREARAGDLVILDYDVELDGQPRDDMQARGRSVEVGRKRLLPELDAGIPGMKPGETKGVELTFADDHAREDVRGKKAVIRVTLHEVRERVLPELDDEFAKDLGDENLEQTRARVRAEMEKTAAAETDRGAREVLLKALGELYKIDIPPSLQLAALESIVKSVGESFGRLLNAGMDKEKMREVAIEEAEKRVRAGLLLGALADQNGLTVTEADIAARMEALAAESGENVARVRSRFADKSRREGLASRILEDKVFEHAFKHIKITDAPAPKHSHDHDDDDDDENGDDGHEHHDHDGHDHEHHDHDGHDHEHHDHEHDHHEHANADHGGEGGSSR